MWLFFGLFLALTALACNVPLEPANVIPPPPTLATGGEAQPTAAADDLPGEQPDKGSAPAATAAPITLVPTATPRTPSGTLPPTDPSAEEGGTPTATATPQGAQSTATRSATETATATPTVSSPASGGQLTLSYTIDWRGAGDGTSDVIARVRLQAGGGGGGYRYYHDDRQVSGPVFEYRWASCRANPGSFRVDSADGQSVRINYYETPPCG
jgi:hypothetical protein